MHSVDRERLVNENLGIVYMLARRFARRLPASADIRELESAGTLGLLDAAARFDPDRGAAFKTFATWRVRGAILDAMRAGAAYSVREHERRERGVGAQLIPLEDARCAGGVPADAGDVLISRRVRQALAQLPRREAQLLVWRFLLNVPQSKRAARLGVNTSRVSHLETRAMRRLRDLLRDIR